MRHDWKIEQVSISHEHGIITKMQELEDDGYEIVTLFPNEPKEDRAPRQYLSIVARKPR